MRQSVETIAADSSEASRAALYLALTKPDVSFLVVMTTVAGYALGTRGPLDWLRMAHTVFGTTLIAAGTSALNHYFERDTDALMRRTASRPLPSGQLSPREAFGAIYRAFLGKDSGPQAGWLLAALDRRFVLGRLTEVARDAA
jgi:heme O synthase-like polyprenyltransferase